VPLVTCNVDTAGIVESDSGVDSDPGTSPANLVACDPLVPRPVTLRTLLGVGQDAQGTLYVADQLSSYTYRVFISVGDTLWRRPGGLGGMRGSGADVDYLLGYYDSDGAGLGSQHLVIQIRGGVTTAMALSPSSSRAFIGDPGATYQLITVLDNAAIAGMKTRDLPHRVCYVGAMDGTEQVVVTGPLGECSEEPRVFYGTKEDMVERQVTGIEDFVFISFLVGSATKQVQIGNPYPDGGATLPPDGGVVVSDGGTVEPDAAGVSPEAGTVEPDAGNPIEGYAFRCLESSPRARAATTDP
jgi:hypothetical protein